VSDTIYQGGIARIVTNVLSLNSKDGTILSVGTDTGFALNGARVPYSALNLSKLLFVGESNKIFSNDGAASVIALTLPTTTEAGIAFKFVRVASFDMRITPPAGSKIRYSGGDMTDGEYLALASDGAKLHLVSDGAGDWIATYEAGTLTEETP
jgi:hypothetical protein